MAKNTYQNVNQSLQQRTQQQDRKRREDHTDSNTNDPVDTPAEVAIAKLREVYGIDTPVEAAAQKTGVKKQQSSPELTVEPEAPEKDQSTTPNPFKIKPNPFSK